MKRINLFYGTFKMNILHKQKNLAGIAPEQLSKFSRAKRNPSDYWRQIISSRFVDILEIKKNANVSLIFHVYLN